MSDRKPDNEPAAQQKPSALARWDNEGGAGPLGPQKQDFPGEPKPEMDRPVDSDHRNIGQAVLVLATRTKKEKYLAAKAHVSALIGFYIHFGVFVTVMLGLFGINSASNGPWWVQWPLLGWGLGVLGHAYLVFSSRSMSMKDWQRRKIKEQMAKM